MEGPSNYQDDTLSDSERYPTRMANLHQFTKWARERSKGYIEETPRGDDPLFNGEEMNKQISELVHELMSIKLLKDVDWFRLAVCVCAKDKYGDQVTKGQAAVFESHMNTLRARCRKFTPTEGSTQTDQDLQMIWKEYSNAPFDKKTHEMAAKHQMTYRKHPSKAGKPGHTCPVDLSNTGTCGTLFPKP